MYRDRDRFWGEKICAVIRRISLHPNPAYFKIAIICMQSCEIDFLRRLVALKKSANAEKSTKFPSLIVDTNQWQEIEEVTMKPRQRKESCSQYKASVTASTVL